MNPNAVHTIKNALNSSGIVLAILYNKLLQTSQISVCGASDPTKCWHWHGSEYESRFDSLQSALFSKTLHISLKTVLPQAMTATDKRPDIAIKKTLLERFSSSVLTKMILGFHYLPNSRQTKHSQNPLFFLLILFI